MFVCLEWRWFFFGIVLGLVVGCACRLKLVVIRCCACSTILALNKKLHFPVDETRLSLHWIYAFTWCRQAWWFDSGCFVVCSSYSEWNACCYCDRINMSPWPRLTASVCFIGHCVWFMIHRYCLYPCSLVHTHVFSVVPLTRRAGAIHWHTSHGRGTWLCVCTPNIDILTVSKIQLENCYTHMQ